MSSKKERADAVKTLRVQLSMAQFQKIRHFNQVSLQSCAFCAYNTVISRELCLECLALCEKSNQQSASYGKRTNQ